MHRRLRHDLEWTAAPRQDGALLRDPVTARTFALSSAQAEILRAAARYPDLATAAQRVSEILGAEISPALIDALLAVFADLALLASDLGPAQIHERQRDARRRFFAESRLEKLQATLTTMRELPYYARLLADAPAIDSLADLARLPILSKATLRAHFDELLPTDPGPDIRWMTTSGTTGERQQVARSQADWAASQAWTWSLNPRVRDALGAPFCRLTTPFCNATECHLQGATRAERTHGRRLALDTGIDIASFPAARVQAIVAEMIEHEPAYLLANPSYLALLVDHARRLRLRLPRPQFVLTAYELCGELQRRAIATAFECPVYDAYGATEYGALILQCEAGRYHVNPESFIVELAPVAGEVGRMLVTSLDKQVMPLLRYDTGDLAVAEATPCTCMWSEAPTLASLEGRLSDAVSTTDGRLVTARAVDRAVTASAPALVAYCLIQHDTDRYRLEYLPRDDLQPDGLAPVMDALHALLGPGARLRSEQRRELLPAPSGKFRLAYTQPAKLRR